MSAATEFLQTLSPYDSLSPSAFERVAGQAERRNIPAGTVIYRHSEPLDGLYIIIDGRVETRDAAGILISELAARESFGERGLLSRGLAVTTATALTDAALVRLPAPLFRALMAEEPAFARFFRRPIMGTTVRSDLAMRKVDTLMSAPPLSCGPQMSVHEAARLMSDRKVSCLGVVEKEQPVGIVTLRDLVGRVVAKGLDPQKTPIAAVMTADPASLKANDLGSDVLHLMLERGIGHLPVVMFDLRPIAGEHRNQIERNGNAV